MTNYNVPAGHVGVHEKVLGPDVEDSVTFLLGSVSTPGWAGLPKQVEILTDGAADIYVTTDGSAPTVAGTNCFRVPPLPGSTTVTVPAPDAGQPALVKLISSGAPTYSVSRAV